MSTVDELANEQSAAALAEEIAKRRLIRLDTEAHKPPWKPRRHYASSLNGCARQLVYARVAWDKKSPFSAEGVAAMQDGIHEEKLLLAELMDDGFDVVEQQVGLDDDRYDVTGRIDGKLKWRGRRVPFEIKRLKPFVFDRIETIADFEGDPFLLKYKRQLTLYLLLHNEPDGLFILSNGLGSRKVIVVPLDYALGEAILHDLDLANIALDNLKKGVPLEEALLPRIPYAPKVCGWCNFKDICLPQVNFGEGAHMAEPELIEKLRRHEELKPLAAELDRLKKEIKTVVEGKEITVAGGYVITGKWVHVTPKPQTEPPKPYQFWKWDVEALNGSPTPTGAGR